MALLQTLPRIPDRFVDLADLTLSAVFKQAGKARRIDFVADQYPSVSIKNIEREKQGRSGQLAVQIRIDTQGSISSSIVLERSSNQEEANTRMFLHYLHF